MSDEHEAAGEERADHAASALRVPSWVPNCLVEQAVKMHARAVHEGHVADAALIARLLTDERIKPVWQELLKHKRVADQPTVFYHTVHPPDGFQPIDPNDTQARALQYLFVESVMAARDLELSGRAEHCVHMAVHIGQDAEAVSRQQGRRYRAIGNLFREAADAYTELAGLLAQKEARRVSVHIANCFRQLFGKAMYGCTATIASVALDQTILPDSVIYWCRSARKAGPSMGKKAKKRRSAP